MPLGLNLEQPTAQYVPEARHKSAGLAFGLSVLIPGVGQFYCGKNARGGMTLAFWLVGLILAIAHPSDTHLGVGLILMLVLWIFSFLDAYFTAIEINRGQDELIEGQNPRVAVTLNLLTAGFGYFYLGEQAKGIALFVAMQVARMFFASSGVVGISLAIVQLLVAVDAYRIARRQANGALATVTAEPAQNPAPASRLPVQVPIVLACLATIGFVALVIVGLVIQSGCTGIQQSRATKGQRTGQQGMGKANPRPVQNDTPVPVVDFTTAVQDVQRVQRKTENRKGEVPNLKLDVRMLSDTLKARKVDASDVTVAHYFRAVALYMINLVREQEGEPTDIAEARTARADLDKIIDGGRILTYVPEINSTNAEYWAGSITRNQLHDEVAAYSYWEKCAANAHGGCMNDLAVARVTGAGGQKVDVNEALALHTSVYDMGTRYQCAGALSAINIAEINYFMGVRRPGDDEMAWVRKADELLDKLEANGSRRNGCHRARLETTEFLLQLSQGHRDDNILQDAVSRLDDDSVATKALIQFMSGALDESGFDAAVSSTKSQSGRCPAYFGAMWYSELRGEGAMAQRFDQRMNEIGKFHCGQLLVFAKKYKF